MRTEAILNLVLKFQVDRACFHGEEAREKKVEKEEEEKEERIEHSQ